VSGPLLPWDRVSGPLLLWDGTRGLLRSGCGTRGVPLPRRASHPPRPFHGNRLPSSILGGTGGLDASVRGDGQCVPSVRSAPHADPPARVRGHHRDASLDDRAVVAAAPG